MYILCQDIGREKSNAKEIGIIEGGLETASESAQELLPPVYKVEYRSWQRFQKKKKKKWARL
jgi:hypothetical protein